jgi:hypothetical protein
MIETSSARSQHSAGGLQRAEAPLARILARVSPRVPVRARLRLRSAASSSRRSSTAPGALYNTEQSQPLPPSLSLTDLTRPVYSYPTNPGVEIDQFSFDLGQPLNSLPSGAGPGKVTLNVHNNQGDRQRSLRDFNLVNEEDGQLLETFDFENAGVDPSTFTSTNPVLLPCGAVPCAFDSLSFVGVRLDPVVSFTSQAGSTAIAFSIVPSPQPEP